jgi:hypothetical protein
MTGTIQHVHLKRGSGIATIILLDETGDVTTVHADAGPFIRSSYEARITVGSTINYEVDDCGVMTSFKLED